MDSLYTYIIAFREERRDMLTMHNIYLRTVDLYPAQEARMRSAVERFHSRWNKHNPGLLIADIGEYEVAPGMYGSRARVRDAESEEVDDDAFGFGDDLDGAGGW